MTSSRSWIASIQLGRLGEPMPELATRTILSPNHYKGWTEGPPRAVIIHSTRSTVASKTDVQELQSTINWFMTVNSQASSHWVVSELERVRIVEDKYPAWHAVEHSWEAYGIEITQPTSDRPYKEGHYQNLVKVCLPYVQAGIPVIHLPSFNYGDTQRGFVGHEETQQGRRDGKSDPGSQFDWTKFISMLTMEADMTPEQLQLLMALKEAMFGSGAQVEGRYDRISIVDNKVVALRRDATETDAAIRAALASHIAIHPPSGKHSHALKATVSGETEPAG